MFANSVTYFPVTGYNIALQTTGTLTSLLWISACGVKPLELPATVMHLIRDKSWWDFVPAVGTYLPKEGNFLLYFLKNKYETLFVTWSDYF